MAREDRGRLATLLANVTEYPFLYDRKIDWWERLAQPGSIPAFPHCTQLLLAPMFGDDEFLTFPEPDDDVKVISVVPITPRENNIVAEHGRQAFLDYWERSGMDIFAPRSDPRRPRPRMMDRETFLDAREGRPVRMRQVITGWALVVGLSVPAPRPLAVREVAVCSVRLELPRGAVVVGRVCLVDQGRLACAGDGIISVPERPPFGAKEASGPRGVLVGPVSIDVREERYAHETRYMVRQASQDPDTLAYVVTKEPLAMDVESRDCPREPRFLEAKENLALFAAGSGAVVLGRPLGSVDWPASGSPWLAVALERVR